MPKKRLSNENDRTVIRRGLRVRSTDHKKQLYRVRLELIEGRASRLIQRAISAKRKTAQDGAVVAVAIGPISETTTEGTL